MTEEQAKTKWCPMVRLIDGQPPGAASTNREYKEFGTEHEESNRCIGAACMMWRWDDVPNPVYEAQSPFMQWTPANIPMTIKSETHGHCGLSGCP